MGHIANSYTQRCRRTVAQQQQQQQKQLGSLQVLAMV
jgi:hypothetical protein